MRGRELSPFVYVFYEGCMVMSWVLLLSGMMKQPGEMAVLLAVPIMLLLYAWLVYRLNRSIGSRGAVAAGAWLVVAVSVLMIARLGTSWFLIAVAVAGFIYVHRISGIMSQSDTMEQMCRGYFLMESIVIPLLAVPSFLTASAHDMVSPVLIPVAAVLSFVLRLFVLLVVQRTLRGTWHFRFRDTVLPAGLILAALLILVTWPMLAYGLLLLMAPFMKWLDYLVLWMQGIFSGVEGQQPEEAGQTEQAAERIQWHYHALNIPNWAFLLIAMLVVVTIWFLLHKNKEKVSQQSTFQPEIQIKRIKWSTNPGLHFTSTTAPIRQIYQQMLRWLEMNGNPIRPSETPREYAQRVELQQSVANEAAHEVGEITRIYEQARYSMEATPSANEPDVLKAREALEHLKSSKK